MLATMKSNSGQTRDDHVVDRIAAGAAHSAHHDAGPQFLQSGSLKMNGHAFPLLFGVHDAVFRPLRGRTARAP